MTVPIWRNKEESSLQGEFWKPFPDCHDYEASNIGRVRVVVNRKNRNGRHFWKGKIITQNSYNKDKRYLRCALTIEGVHKSYGSHRIVASAFIPNPYGKEQVNHKDGDPTNNYIENLEWVTAKENSLHAWDAGLVRTLCGDESPHSKLKSTDVLDILHSYYFGLSSKQDIANSYGMMYEYITLIIKGERWSDLVLPFRKTHEKRVSIVDSVRRHGYRIEGKAERIIEDQLKLEGF